MLSCTQQVWRCLQQHPMVWTRRNTRQSSLHGRLNPIKHLGGNEIKFIQWGASALTPDPSSNTLVEAFSKLHKAAAFIASAQAGDCTKLSTSVINSRELADRGVTCDSNWLGVGSIRKSCKQNNSGATKFLQSNYDKRTWSNVARFTMLSGRDESWQSKLAANGERSWSSRARFTVKSGLADKFLIKSSINCRLAGDHIPAVSMPNNAAASATSPWIRVSTACRCWVQSCA